MLLSRSLSVGLLILCVLSAAQAQLRLFNLRASKLDSGIIGTVDGYVKAFSGAANMGKTKVRNNDPNPWWTEEFNHYQAQANDVLRLEVYDSDILFDDLLGTCHRNIKVGTHQHECYLKKGGSLHYSYTLVDKQQGNHTD